MIKATPEDRLQLEVELQQTLIEDVAKVEALIANTSLDEVLEKHDWPIQVKRWMWKDRYYKGLVAYCSLLRPRSVLELGTCTGASAACLAVHCDNVVTCDVTDWSIADKGIFGDRITFHACDTPSNVLTLDYSRFDLVFIDIDHRGAMERLIHRKLLDDRFCGDAFFDDICANSEMKAFWSAVNSPKLELDWHCEGFGVVRYGQRYNDTARVDAKRGETRES